MIKYQSQLDYVANAAECQLQCFAFQEQDKEIVRECLYWSSESSNIVSTISFLKFLNIAIKMHYKSMLKYVQRKIPIFELSNLNRDMEKNNISEIHEDAFLPLNNLKDL